ncbi:MAG: DUF1045 domain-containing protein [Burkholderiales bacterium]|nr:DUF1045 domain-containing protein [Burkholderiales bacterium]
MTDPTQTASPRWAVYYAPAAGSPWWRFGSAWLGRDEIADRPLAQTPPPAGIDGARWSAMTEAPRRYGFHATLKAPFRLADGVGESDLRAALAATAARLRPVPLGALVPRVFDGWVALTAPQADEPLAELAACCVVELDALRAPLSADELARRRPRSLDARGRELLLTYGYPQVLERFRFHLTLAAVDDPALAERVRAAAEAAVASLGCEHPAVLDRLCLFVEPAPGAPLRRVHEVALARG